MRHCERIARSHARTFALASRFLPSHKRRATFALYAFCRVADDMVDDAALDGRAPTAKRLAGYARRLSAALDGAPSDAIFRELAWTVREFDVPRELLDELLDGIARDLQPARYETWSELARYCEGVASSVGAMCTYVFGVQDGDGQRLRALQHARTLGLAMQLTNILRDVGEDAGRGRVYLPEEDLRRFGLDSDAVLARTVPTASDAWHAFMRFQLGRARTLYDHASPGITLLARDAQKCARACALGYAGILDAIEAIGFDVVSVRARVSPWARASLLWRIWSGRAAGHGLAGEEHVATRQPHATSIPGEILEHA